MIDSALVYLENNMTFAGNIKLFLNKPKSSLARKSLTNQLFLELSTTSPFKDWAHKTSSCFAGLKLKASCARIYPSSSYMKQKISSQISSQMWKISSQMWTYFPKKTMNEPKEVDTELSVLFLGWITAEQHYSKILTFLNEVWWGSRGVFLWDRFNFPGLHKWWLTVPCFIYKTVWTLQNVPLPENVKLLS